MIDFLKLGGSLITDKDTPLTARRETIQRLAAEIRQAQREQPDLKLVIGHGSGSFGHHTASQFGTRQGVYTPEEWQGFVEVWHHARMLNHIMLDAFYQAGIPAMAFPPSAILFSRERKPASLQAEPLMAALRAGLTPIVAGDVVFDAEIGGTIFSTEDVFNALATSIHPDWVFLCGKDEGVYEDYPACTHFVPRITPATYPRFRQVLSSSASIDVTGGMRDKVESMLELVRHYPETKVLIFSGEHPGALFRTLSGEQHGTIITS